MRLSGMRQRVLLRSLAALSDACKHYPYTLDVRDIRFDTRERYHLAPPLLTSSSYAIRARASGFSPRTRELRKVERRWKFCRSFHSIFPARSFHRPRHSLGLPSDRADDSRECRESHAAPSRARALVSAASVTLSNANSPSGDRSFSRVERSARGNCGLDCEFSYRIRDREPRRVRVSQSAPRNFSVYFPPVNLSLSLSLSLSLFFFLFFLQR